MGKYDLTDENGRALSKRLRYFDGQFLQDTDFIDEQKYQLDRRLRLTRGLHASGVTTGLNVSVDSKTVSILVSDGTAIDDQGRLVVLPAAVTLSASARSAGEDLVILITFTEKSSDQATTGAGAAGDTRFQEVPTVSLKLRSEWDSSVTAGTTNSAIPLGRVVMTQDASDASKVAFLDNAVQTDVRRYAGVSLPGPDGQAKVSLRVAKDSRGGTGEVSGRLSVTDAVGIGALPRSDAGLTVNTNSGRIVANGLYFAASGASSDGLPKARLTEQWGMRYSAPATTHPFSVAPSLVVGYSPSGSDYGTGNVSVSGKVGIGVELPSAKLDVVGNSNFAGDLTVTGKVMLKKLASDANAAATSTLLVETPTVNSHREANVGNLTGVIFRASTAPASGDPIFQVRGDNSSSRFFVEHDGYTGSKDNAAWFGSTARTNTFLGSVAIGTTSASKRLEMRGDIRFNDNNSQRVYGNTVDGHNTVVVAGQYNELRIKGRVLDWTGGALQVGFAGDSLSQEVQFGNSLVRVKQAAVIEGNLSFSQAYQQRISLYGTGGSLAIGAQTSTTYFRTSNDFAWYRGGAHNDARGNSGGGTRDMVLNEGKLGIGTSGDPSRTLEVAGDFSLGSPISTRPTTSGDYAGARTYFEGVNSNDTPYWMGRYLTVTSGPAYQSELRVNLGSSTKTGQVRFGIEGAWNSGLAITGDGNLLVGNGVLPFKLVYVGGFRDQAAIDLEYDLYEAMIVGFRSGSGDIQESDSGVIMRMHTEKDGNNNRWRVVADFRSHNTNETWDVWVMGVWKKWVTGARTG